MDINHTNDKIKIKLDGQVKNMDILQNFNQQFSKTSDYILEDDLKI